jgi:voltage-gated potassium channel
MRKKLSLAFWFGIILFIMTVGVAGFMITSNYDFLDAVYMTVITIATIGYQEVRPLTTAGRIFNIVYIVSSFAVFTYALSRLTLFIASGEMARYFKNRKLMKAINNINNHVIICGFGRNGQQAARILLQHKTDFVVIDKDDAHFGEWLEEHNELIYIQGNATEDETLLKAGISKAKALLLTLPEDADNVFIVLSARTLNPKLQIISKAAQKSSIKKLKTAGADHVILPDVIGGAHMATLVSKPDVIEFMNYLWGDISNTINIESIGYENLPGHLRDRSIYEIINSKQTGVACIGLKNKEGEFIINPPPDTLIHGNMKIMLLGTTQQMMLTKQLLNEER